VAWSLVWIALTCRIKCLGALICDKGSNDVKCWYNTG
jgi:hypothetical protein